MVKFTLYWVVLDPSLVQKKSEGNQGQTGAQPTALHPVPWCWRPFSFPWNLRFASNWDLPLVFEKAGMGVASFPKFTTCQENMFSHCFLISPTTCVVYYLSLRNYTPEFGNKIAQILEYLLPPCDYVTHDPSLDPIQVWKSWEWEEDCWDDAKLRSFVKYLYGAKRLQIPDPWRKVLPRVI